jgi:hypothetical protein
MWLARRIDVNAHSRRCQVLHAQSAIIVCPHGAIAGRTSAAPHLRVFVCVRVGTGTQEALDLVLSTVLFAFIEQRLAQGLERSLQSNRCSCCAGLPLCMSYSPKLLGE